MDTTAISVIARIHNDFPTKFGIPRQSGLVPSLPSIIIFEPEFRQSEALRGLEKFSHLWLIWGFSESEQNKWSPTVRPPRLGGNVRKGVFATRSPFRPNPIGLSSVTLDQIVFNSNHGNELHVSGADLMDGTPIYDIKPYLPYTDCHNDAVDEFSSATKEKNMTVIFPENLAAKLPQQQQDLLRALLLQDPRPAYQNDPERVYGFKFARFEIKFVVNQDILTICNIVKTKKIK